MQIFYIHILLYNMLTDSSTLQHTLLTNVNVQHQYNAYIMQLDKPNATPTENILKECQSYSLTTTTTTKTTNLNHKAIET